MTQCSRASKTLARITSAICTGMALALLAIPNQLPQEGKTSWNFGGIDPYVVDFMEASRSRFRDKLCACRKVDGEQDRIY